MEVKEGQKDNFIDAIFDMKQKAFNVLAVFALLILFSYYLFFAAFIFWFFLVVHLGKRDEKKYCYYKPYNRLAFLDNYFVGLYHSFDVNQLSTLRDLLIGTIMFSTFSFMGFLNEKFGILFYFSCFFSFVCFAGTLTFLIKYVRSKSIGSE